MGNFGSKNNFKQNIRRDETNMFRKNITKTKIDSPHTGTPTSLSYVGTIKDGKKFLKQFFKEQGKLGSNIIMIAESVQRVFVFIRTRSRNKSRSQEGVTSSKIIGPCI